MVHCLISSCLRNDRTGGEVPVGERMLGVKIQIFIGDAVMKLKQFASHLAELVSTLHLELERVCDRTHLISNITLQNNHGKMDCATQSRGQRWSMCSNKFRLRWGVQQQVGDVTKMLSNTPTVTVDGNTLRCCRTRIASTPHVDDFIMGQYNYFVIHVYDPKAQNNAIAMGKRISYFLDVIVICNYGRGMTRSVIHSIKFAIHVYNLCLRKFDSDCNPYPRFVRPL